MSSSTIDAFKHARAQSGHLEVEIGDETISMLLTYRGVRAAAQNWQDYSSDAPFRVPIPSEESQRSVRQLPIETDPPQHRPYRALLEPMLVLQQEMAAIQRDLAEIATEAAVPDFPAPAAAAEALDQATAQLARFRQGPR